MKIRTVSEKDQKWVQSMLSERWGSPVIISRENLHNANQLPGFIAIKTELPVGLITYSLKNNECEIVTLDSLESGKRLLKPGIPEIGFDNIPIRDEIELEIKLH